MSRGAGDTVRSLAGRINLPASTVGTFLSGTRLPRKSVVLAIVREYGGDEAGWGARYDELADRLGASSRAPQMLSDVTLSDSPFRFGDHAIERIREIASEESFSPGDLIFGEGDPITEVYVLKEGLIKEVKEKDPADREFVLVDFRGPREVLNFDFFDCDTYSISTIAASHGVLFRAPTNDFTSLLLSESDLARALAGMIAARLRSATRRRISRGLKEKFLTLLVDLGARIGSTRSDGSVKVAISMQEVAHLMDVSEITVQRLMRDLRSKGLIYSGYRMIVLPASVVAEEADQ
ncbi:Crp/Fnr family transcriptional regulator [Amycolatopsis sp. NPDC051061]|uniref:Crp/Fnr family transcriptional regulator n=1 Tax=Amycolatopsis sp. NPDC051061 TaxID=3155042 RepID=UPI00343AED01